MGLIACPNCKMEVSSRAEACPYCDYTLVSELDLDVKKARRFGYWLTLAITALYFGTNLLEVPAPQWLGSSGSDVFKSLYLTAPLVMATTFIGYAWSKGWLDMFYSALILITSSLAIAGLVSYVLPLGLDHSAVFNTVTHLPETLKTWDTGFSEPKGWLASLLLLLINYFKLYGLRNFIAALLIGTYAAWVLHKNIVGRLIQERMASREK